jgi:PDZ domain-containing protein
MPGRPAFYVAGKVLPGWEVVKRSDYAGNTSDSQFDRELADAMKDSQMVAEIVAERAAGLPVTVDLETKVAGVQPSMPGAHCLRADDVILSVNGVKPVTSDVLGHLTSGQPVGSAFVLAVERRQHRAVVTCRTAMFRGRPRFGIIVSTRVKSSHVPVNVAYSVKDINGSSAGLMFALQIYRSLVGHPLARGKDIAGTGVLSIDGGVLPVGGAKQKLAAAINKHAQIFLVPRADYPNTEGTPGITILPVRSFNDALAQLQTM